MKNILKRYINIYKLFVETSITEAMNYRFNFVLINILQVFVFISSLGTIEFIYDNVSHIGPWDKYQFLFFISFVLTVTELVNGLIQRNFWEFSVLLIKGNLDFYLLKPASPIFSVFFRFIRPYFIVAIVCPICFLIYSGIKVELSFLQWLLLPGFIVISTALYMALGILICTFMFWSYEGSGINFIRIQFGELVRWPDFTFFPLPRIIFSTLLPFLVIGTIPTKILLDLSHFELLIYELLILVFVIIVIKIIWKKGLLQYESASS